MINTDWKIFNSHPVRLSSFHASTHLDCLFRNCWSASLAVIARNNCRTGSNLRARCCSDPLLEVRDVPSYRRSCADVAANVRGGETLGSGHKRKGSVARDAAVVCGSEVWHVRERSTADG